MRKFAALALVLALTGCSAQTPAPTLTPVDLKYCALSDAAGFNDDGLNRSVYAALQQLKVQKGAAVVALEVGAKLAADQGLQDLVDANCDVVITAGEDLAKPALAKAKANQTIRFVSVGDIINTGDSSPNFVSLTFNVYEAAYAAGYLAAASAPSEEIATLDLLNSDESKKSIKAFGAGVARFNSENRTQVKIASLKDIFAAGQDVVFVLSGDGTKLTGWPKTNDTGAMKLVKLIGYGRDWYADARNKNLRPYILTSVVRVGVTDKVVAAVLAGSGSRNFDLASGQVGLIPENDLAFPSKFATSLDAIINDFSNGKVKVG